MGKLGGFSFVSFLFGSFFSPPSVSWATDKESTVEICGFGVGFLLIFGFFCDLQSARASY